MESEKHAFLEYIDLEKKLPSCLTMSLAAYIAFYSSDIQRREKDALICKRPKGNEYRIQDDAWVLDFYYEHREDSIGKLVQAVLSNQDMWGQDLTQVDGLCERICDDLNVIRIKGTEEAFAACLSMEE